MIYYFQKNRNIFSVFSNKSISGQFNASRRFDYKYNLEFSNQILFIWMLAFAIRIGSLLFFVFTDIMEPELASALYNINLPYSNSLDKIENKRLCIYLTVISDGRVKLNGEEIIPENLHHVLSIYRIELPNLIINIIADKDCKMESVLNVLSACKMAGTRRIFFLVDKRT